MTSMPLRLAVGGLLALTAALGIGRFVYTPILPAMIESLGWSKSEAGLVASANFLGYLVGALLSARPIAPGRRRFWLIASLLVSVATTAGMAFDESLPLLMVLRAIGGAASAFVIVLASTLVLARLAAAGRTNLSALHFAGVGSGIALSAVLVSAMLAAGAGWRGLWIGAGVAALIATALVIFLIDEDEAPSPVTATPPLREPARGLPLIIAAYGLFGFGYVITTTFIVTIVRMAPEIRALEAWIWVLFGLAAIPSVVLWSRIGVRLGLMPAFALACVTEAAGVLASVEWQTPVGMCVAALFVGGTFMGLTALGLVAARQASGAGAQRAIGLMTASFATGQMVGPAVAGYLYDRLGSFRVPSLLAAGALLLAAGLAMLSRRRSDHA